MARYLGDDFVVPLIDPTNEAWFTSGELHVQFCNACDAAQHPPEELCRHCGETDLALRPLPGEGTVESAVVVEHPVHPGLVERCPYVVAVVSLDGAPGCNERLGGDLTSEDAHPTFLGAVAAEDVEIEFLEIEQRDEVVEEVLLIHPPKVTQAAGRSHGHDVLVPLRGRE